MSKKIKQDYEEQKRQAAETNAINQLETFHAESMTMEAHKSRSDRVFPIGCECLPVVLGRFSEKSIVSTLFKSWEMIKSKSSSLCTIETLKRIAPTYPNEMDMFYSNLHTIGALFDLFQHVSDAH